MPIRQPRQTTIYTSDFRDKPYCFVVESVLLSEDRVGLLTVSTSAGYLITTSLSKDPRREHTFPHHQQADNSWVAEGYVMLIITSDSPTDGLITIRNSQSETVVLAIEATSTPRLHVQQPQPVLALSEPLPAFTRTIPGKPSYLVLTITQQYTNAPVTLTTDAPDYFQLASDSRPAFLPDLTLTPSATGTHVHIRYVAQKGGVHTGHLLIETAYQTRTIALKGSSSRLLPAIQKPMLPVSQARLPQPATSLPDRAASPKRWIGGVALFLTAGLAYAGYTNRCQLFPALCASTPVSQASPPNRTSTSVSGPPEEVAINKIALKPVKTERPLTSALRTLPANLPAQLPKERPAETQRAGRKVTPSGQLINQELNSQPAKQKIAPKPPVSVTEESDLERALNRPL